MIRFSTLGTPCLERDADGHRVHLSLQPKLLALLAYLCLEAGGRPLRRDRIVYLLWPELDQDRARAALSQALYRLRERIGSDAVLTFGQDEIAVNWNVVWCDAVELDAALTDERGEDALQLYTGELLEGFHLASAPDFERWQADRRRRVRDAVAGAALRVAEKAESRNDLHEGIRVLRRAREVAPLDPVVLHRLLALLDAVGTPEDAVRVYDAYVTRLRGEYDLAPAPETQDAIATIMAKVQTVLRPHEPKRVPPIRSVAVLAFRTIGERPGAVFAGGLPDEITGALARLSAVEVIAGWSSSRFLSGEQDPCDVSSRLGVDAVLEGTIQVDGTRMRIHTRLVRGRDGAVVWSRTYDRDVSAAALFSTQEAVARAVANALRIELDPAASERLRWRPTGDLEAYSLYLRGRHAWSRRSPDGLEAARRLFRRSLRRDPAYAAAWSGLADTLTMLPLYAPVDRVEARRKARAAAARAVELDEGSAEAHAALARSLESEREWDASAAEYRRALQLNPSYATAHHWYANHLLRRGQSTGALVEIEQAIRLDPLSPAVRTGHAFIQYLLRQYERAIRSATKATSIECAAEGAHLVLAMAHAEGGDPRDAVEICTRFHRRFAAAPRAAGALAYALARAGAAARARAVLGDAEDSDAEPLMLAAARAALGDADEAFRHLARADWGTINVDMLAHSAVFDPLRADPRYLQLSARLGLVAS